MVNYFTKNQEQVKKIFEKKEKSRDFEIGDLFFVWGKRREIKGMHNKFDSLWIDPFNIHGEKKFFLHTTMVLCSHFLIVEIT